MIDDPRTVKPSPFARRIEELQTSLAAVRRWISAEVVVSPYPSNSSLDGSWRRGLNEVITTLDRLGRHLDDLNRVVPKAPVAALGDPPGPDQNDEKTKNITRMDSQCDSTDARTAPAVLPDAHVLRPCPFCGGEAAFATVRYSATTDEARLNGQDLFHYVSCIACGACNRGLIGHKNQFLAGVRWNSRPLEQA